MQIPNLLPVFFLVVGIPLLAHADVVRVEVTIKSVDAKGRTITAIRKGKTLELDVSLKAPVTINGKEVTLRSLKSGQKAVLSYHADFKVVTKIEVKSEDDATLVTGKLSLPERIRNRGFPSVFQAWSPADNLPNEDKLRTLARHDLVWRSPTLFGLRWETRPTALATSFSPDSIRVGQSMRQSLLTMNPNMIFIAEIRYRDAPANFFPESHAWWLRDKRGRRRKGWAEGGYYLLDFSNVEYQRHVASRAKAAVETGVFDGVFLDWWGDDSDRLSLVRTVRNAIGSDHLIIANANDRKTPRTAPYINGYFMECFRSKTAADWNRIISTLVWAEENLRSPRVNCLETWHHRSRNDLPLMRSVTTLSLTLSNGYCLFSDPNPLPAPDHLHNWYPFWTRTLGQPLSKGVRRSDGSFAREFEHGTAVFNPMGNRRATVSFEKSRRSVNTGKDATRHIISPGDGDLFIGTGRLFGNGTAVTSTRTSPDNQNALAAVLAIAKSVKVNRNGDPISVDLSDVSLTGAQLGQLGTFTSLRQLTLPKTRLTDAGLKKLETLTNLTSLGMWQTNVTSDGLRHVGKLANLNYLSVEGNRRITDDGLKHLANLRKLSWLGLSYTGVTDEGMRHLAELPLLNRLDIAHTKLTDRGLNELMRIRSLKTLTVTGTKVTDAGVAKFKRALRNCKVTR
jgi:hypothetical protein